MKKPEEISSDIFEWPESWAGTEEDIRPGRQIVDIFYPFIEDLIEKGLKRKTIKNHIDNLWLLGGELIREINIKGGKNSDVMLVILEKVGPEGGPYCKHIGSKSERRSFDTTCRKLYKYVTNRIDEDVHLS